MNEGQALESGTGSDSVKGPILDRLASAVARTLGRRKKRADGKSAIPQSERPDSQKGLYSDAENEEACAKIWSIYVGEAERYDSALVESWRADMEGMLIFSGLFSASLTAFLIESYKVLQPDSGDLTVAGIAQLSQQLAAIASNQTFVIPPSSSFTPTVGSLWCNALWFISLSLSLTCALLATLVEQWAREFLHKTEMRPSPLRRARVFSFLYFGLKQFRMHTIVDAIPFLLHAAFLLFFAGLVAFLLPVNRIMMYLMCIVLFVFLVLYSVLTILPVVRLSCPYRTPLSAPLWSMLQGPFAFFNKSDSSEQQTMTEAVAALALQDTRERDQRALQWTLDSLTDDVELLPFVEAIPDIIHGPNGFRRANDALFETLLGTIEVASPLVSRISALMIATKGMSWDEPLRVRRHTAGYQAVWALSMIPYAWDRFFDFDGIIVGSSDGLVNATTLALQYQAQRWIHHLIGTLRDLLDNHSLTDSFDKVLPTIQRRVRLLLAHKDLIVSPFASRSHSPHPCLVHFTKLEALYNTTQDSMPTVDDLQKSRHVLAALHDAHDWAYNTLVFMADFINTGVYNLRVDESRLPFEALETCYSILSEIKLHPPRRIVTDTQITFSPTIQNVNFSGFPPPLDMLAQIVFRVFPFFSNCNIHRYLGQRRNAVAIRYALEDCDLGELARKLAFPLPIYRDIDSAILEITTVASCLSSDSEAVRFIDIVLKQGPPELTQSPAIREARYLRRLQQVVHVLCITQWTSLPQAAALLQVQSICHDEFFHDISPLFLPRDVHISTVIRSLRIHLINKSISFLSDFFQNSIPIAAKLNILAFDRLDGLGAFLWTNVDPEVQDHFFEAVLAYTRVLALSAPSQSRSDMAALQSQLWNSCLFWIHWVDEGPSPTIEGIKPSGLELLRESLELYLDAVVPPADGRDISMDSLPRTKRLLAEIQKHLPPTIVLSTSDGKNAGGSIQAEPLQLGEMMEESRGETTRDDSIQSVCVQ